MLDSEILFSADGFNGGGLIAASPDFNQSLPACRLSETRRVWADFGADSLGHPAVIAAKMGRSFALRCESPLRKFDELSETVAFVSGFRDETRKSELRDKLERVWSTAPLLS